MAESVRDLTSKFRKLDMIEGNDFCFLPKKMNFLLTSLKGVHVVRSSTPEPIEDKAIEHTRRRCKWNNDDYICCGHILNGMYDSPFDL